MEIDFRYLKAFIATAEHSSFSKAAEILGIAQSAISRQIKLLEESVGEELIVRSSKKILLTDKGKALYTLTSDFGKTAIDIFKSEDNRPIRIGILHGLLENWLCTIIVDFYKKYERNISIHIADPKDLREGIQNGLYDVVFTIENIQSELVTSLHIFDEQMILISASPVDINHLEAHRWITFGDTDFILKLTKQHSNKMITVGSITSIVRLVAHGVGIAVVPDHAVKNTEGLFCYHLPQLNKSEIYMSTLSYKTMPLHIKELIHLIK